MVAGAFPPGCLLTLLASPLLVSSGRRALSTCERPRDFVPAIGRIVACYLVAVGLFTLGLLGSGLAASA